MYFALRNDTLLFRNIQKDKIWILTFEVSKQVQEIYYFFPVQY